VAFAIEADDLAAWEKRLAASGVEIESRVSWDRGGRSLYFRDPEGRSVELATPGTWATY
jgi:catechol 2,3-dioxygenase-like lactoylglutathione lyase family enzyme